MIHTSPHHLPLPLSVLIEQGFSQSQWLVTRPYYRNHGESKKDILQPPCQNQGWGQENSGRSPDWICPPIQSRKDTPLPSRRWNHRNRYFLLPRRVFLQCRRLGWDGRGSFESNGQISTPGYILQSPYHRSISFKVTQQLTSSRCIQRFSNHAGTWCNIQNSNRLRWDHYLSRFREKPHLLGFLLCGRIVQCMLLVGKRHLPRNYT